MQCESRKFTGAYKSSSQRMATDSVEVFHASSCKAGGYLGRGDDGSDRMTIAHRLS